MSERLPTGLLVGSLLRRVNDAGAIAVVRARGDPGAGAVLFIMDEGAGTRVLERGLGPDGTTMLIESRLAAVDDGSAESYWRRRRRQDPDLWVVELCGAKLERFVAETMLVN